MAFTGGSWQPVPRTAAVLAFYTAGSTALGYSPNQLHEDWVAFHCNTTAREIAEMAQVAKTIPAHNSTDKKTIDVLAYSGYAGLGLGDPSSTTYYGDLRQRYGVDWAVLAAAGLTVAMVRRHCISCCLHCCLFLALRFHFDQSTDPCLT